MADLGHVRSIEEGSEMIVTYCDWTQQVIGVSGLIFSYCLLPCLYATGAWPLVWHQSGAQHARSRRQDLSWHVRLLSLRNWWSPPSSCQATQSSQTASFYAWLSAPRPSLSSLPPCSHLHQSSSSRFCKDLNLYWFARLAYYSLHQRTCPSGPAASSLFSRPLSLPGQTTGHLSSLYAAHVHRQVPMA